MNGIFVISLDFELFWGVRDKETLEHYGRNIAAVRDVVPRLLDLFAEYRIHATWATLGFLFCESKEELLAMLPEPKPEYVNERLSPFAHIESIGENEPSDPLHFAPSLIRQIASRPHQEIASHTFSHYYGLERGQTIETFKADLHAAFAAAAKFGIVPTSLVFPRNQVNPDYLPVCREKGITAYRGALDKWIYRPQNEEDESPLRRAARLIDAFVNVAGHHSYPPPAPADSLPLNIPASRFLRPVSANANRLDALKQKRIFQELTHAAQKGQIYHLWWHPHNFGQNIERNFEHLRAILERLARLQEQYGMQSLNMAEVASLLQSGEAA